MAFAAETGDHKVTRSDIFLVDPRALIVDWRKNLSRNGEEPPVDEALIELARDMMPKKGQGDAEDGTSGQINPVLTRPLPDRRLEVIGGFRRMRAALWLIESGTCPDFKVKYTVSRLSDAEAALVNLSENLQREDPRPVQLAHAIRIPDGGLRPQHEAGRRSPQAVGDVVLEPAQPRHAPDAHPGERGQRRDAGLRRPGASQAPRRPADQGLRHPHRRRRKDHCLQGQGE